MNEDDIKALINEQIEQLAQKMQIYLNVQVKCINEDMQSNIKNRFDGCEHWINDFARQLFEIKEKIRDLDNSIG